MARHEIENLVDRFGNKIEFKDKELREKVDTLNATAASAVEAAQEALQYKIDADAAAETAVQAAGDAEISKSDTLAAAERAEEALEQIEEITDYAGYTAQVQQMIDAQNTNIANNNIAQLNVIDQQTTSKVAQQVAAMQVIEGQTVIDSTLTVSGAAAEAAKVGTEITELKNDLNSYVWERTINLFNPNDLIYGKNWSLGNNTRRAVLFTGCEASTEYTFTISDKTGFGIIIYELPSKGSTSVLAAHELSGNTITWTTVSDQSLTVLCVQFDKDNISPDDIASVDIQLEKGGKTDFTPYYLVNDITLKKKVAHLEPYVVPTRNLFNLDDVIVGLDWSLGSNSSRAICPIQVSGNTEYTFSLQDKTGLNSIILFEKANYSDTSPLQSRSITGKVLTFTTVSTCTWLFVQYDKTSISKEDVVKTLTQLELGSVATEYIQHYSAFDIVARENAENRVQKNMTDPIFYTSADTMKDIVDNIKSWKDNHDKMFYGGNLDLNKPTVITPENYTEVENATLADVGKYLVSCSTFGNMILQGVDFDHSVCSYQTVSSVADMTDTSKIYRYYGTETGYTDDYYKYENGVWTVTSVKNVPYYPYGYKVLADTSKYAKKYDEPTDRLYAWSLAEYGYDMGYGFIPDDYSQCRTGDLLFELNEGNHAGDGKWFHIYHIGVFLRKNADESITIAEISDWATDTPYAVHDYAPIFISTFPKGSNLYKYFSKFAARFPYGIGSGEYNEVQTYINEHLI